MNHRDMEQGFNQELLIDENAPLFFEKREIGTPLNDLSEQAKYVDFQTIEEVIKFYHAIPFDEFDRRFRRGDDDFYKDLHPDETVAVAMNIIILYGNLQEYAAYHVTQSAYDSLLKAEELLSNVTDDDMLLQNCKRYASQYISLYKDKFLPQERLDELYPQASYFYKELKRMESLQNAPTIMITEEYVERSQSCPTDTQQNIPKWMKDNYVKVTKTVEQAFMDSQFQLLTSIHFAEQLDDEDLATARELADLQERFRNENYDRETAREMFEKERDLEDHLLSHWQEKGFPKIVYEEGGKVGMKDFKGDVMLPAEYEDFLLTYEREDIFNPNYIIALKHGRWGLMDKYGNENLPFEYNLIFPIENDAYGVKLNGMWGIYNALGNKWELPCKHEQIYSHEPSPMYLYVFSDKGKFGWTGCQIKENDVEAEYDAVYLPNEEYFFSKEYGDESETFEAIKDGEYHEIEYWTLK